MAISRKTGPGPASVLLAPLIALALASCDPGPAAGPEAPIAAGHEDAHAHAQHTAGAAAGEQGAGEQPAGAVAIADLPEAFGIELVGMRRTAANYMLDLRYRVLDPEKAKPLLAYENKPMLVLEETGNMLSVPHAPKVGSLRTSTQFPKANRQYYVLFANPGGLVKQGDRVSVRMGPAFIRDIQVM